MDKRLTLNIGQTFMELLRQLQSEQSKASMLYDCNGLTRAEGIISEIVFKADQPFIELQNGLTIAVSTIIAVNGIFLPEYSEC